MHSNAVIMIPFLQAVLLSVEVLVFANREEPVHIAKNSHGSLVKNNSKDKLPVHFPIAK